MRSEGVVLPSPALSQDPGLRSRGEQLGVEDLITEPSLATLGNAVLPRGSRIDIGHAGGVAGITPVL